MGKPKQFLKNESKPKGKRPQPAPETADEFLAGGSTARNASLAFNSVQRSLLAASVGVDHESAGEKWRAGDAAKSSRFFVRALEVYQTGLQRFPKAFDLAYNKARVQLDLAQQPRLLKHLPTSEADLLQQALQSHRYALALEPEDANTLFNTAQLLAIISEPLAREGPTAQGGQEAAPLLKEALQLLDKCLAVQERQYAEFEAQFAAARDMQQGETVPVAANAPEKFATQPASPSGESEQWASVIEPVTKATLLDTCLAQMQTLAALIPLVGENQSTVHELDSAANTLIQRGSTLLENEEGKLSYDAECAKLLVAEARVGYLTSMTTAREYADVVKQKYRFDGLEASVSALCDFAEAVMEMNGLLSAVQESQVVHSRWQLLSDALNGLSKAVKLPDVDNLAGIHGQRADMELLRAKLAEPPFQYPQAVTNKATLLQNAETFYRGATKLAEAAGESELVKETRKKEAVVKAIRQDQMNREDLQDSYLGMKEEGLL